MKEIIDLLAEKNLTLGSVESMTGGLFAAKITSIPGASKVFKGTIVTYQTEEKINLLGVDKHLIKECGVVSSEVAASMAQKGQRLLDVDVCVSVTGNAGPTCEPGGKPVGCVYIAFTYQNDTFIDRLLLSGSRDEIRNLTIDKLIEFIKKHLK